MEFTLYTIGGFDVFVTLFQAIGAILGNNEGTYLNSLVRISIAIGVFSTLIYAALSVSIRPILRQFVMYVVFVNGMLMPSTSIRIVDKMTNQSESVDNIPVALVLVASGLSQISYGLTKALEVAFQPRPTTASSSTPIQGASTSFAQVSYSETGFIFGAHAIAQMKGLQIEDHDFAENMREFVCQCVVYDALSGAKYTMNELRKSNDIWKLVSTNASKIRGFTWRKLNPNGAQSSSGEMTERTEIITCAEGVKRIDEIWQGATESVVGRAQNGLLEMFGFKGSNAIFSTALKTNLPGAMDKLLGYSTSAEARIKQQIMIDSVVDGIEKKSVEMGAAPNFEVRRAYLQQRESYKTIGQLAAQTLPNFKNVLEALFYASFIFIIFASLLPSGWKVFLFWIKGCVWINFWPPLFTILNFMMTEGLTYKLKNTLGTDQGFTIANSVAIANCAADMSAFAGYLCSLIPCIAWMVLRCCEHTMGNIASSAMQVSQGAATSSANDMITGNFSYGNVGIGATQMYNTSQFKHDAAPSYTAGHFTENSGAVSRTIGADGNGVLKVDSSNLPIKINSAKHQEHVKRDAYNSSMALHESENQQAANHRSNAVRKYIEFAKNASEMEAKGQVWANSTTSGAMKEASRMFNKIHELANNLHISDDAANQMLIAASAGIGESGLLKMLGTAVGANASLNGTLSTFSDDKLSQGVSDIMKLAKSDDFKNAISHLTQANRSGDFHINDQTTKSIADNISSNYEDSEMHSKNSSKALERAKSLSQEIAHIQSDSHRIDTDETQSFVNWAHEQRISDPELANMALNKPKEMEELGQRFLREKYGTISALPATNKDLEGGYMKSQYGHDGIVSERYRGEVSQKAAENNMDINHKVDDSERKNANDTIHARQSSVVKIGKTMKTAYANEVVAAKNAQDKTSLGMIRKTGNKMKKHRDALSRNRDKFPASDLE